MTKIKFGTDGWRAIIARDYTVDNVKRVAEATAIWLKNQSATQVVIGHDCRFGGEMFAETATGIMGAYGLKVFLAKGFVSTPMVSLGVVKTGSDLGIVITASHNPPSYNGFKLKSRLGGPTIPSDVAAVEAEIPEVCSVEPMDLETMEAKGLLEYTDLENIYIEHIKDSFDMDAIRSYGNRIAYDAMYGAGMNAMRALLPDANFLHAEYNPSFMGQAPEPIHRNLTELSEFIAKHDHIALGIANDGDADRIGMYDSSGNFVDSHHILLLLLLYQRKYRNMDGKVVITFSVTEKMKKMARLFGLPVEVTPIGFKYIAEIMAREDVIVGGEESGGLAVKGHIPERDGIYIAFIILEFMAKTGKSIEELIQEVYDMVGPFAYDRDDVHVAEERKQEIIKVCKTEPYKKFGSYKVDSVETIDGFKFIIGDDRWLLIRPSGTEPVLRVYAQAPDLAETRQLLDAARAELGI
ncbi:phosphohexomutase domain-containing protein [Flavilitoribacter nigricans]|uniref:Phosphoglucosamine mutase n=1 Tax=Flavilitoribacter nigricans (strain ATCC 23147 / DSM 23189 / NBRC 102662 / NCIMB 1420 / SS-2) TaxID=1122177 RepID=A0A2D0NFD7_FLAN2|nr:phosphoglucosamine mutase [Flavilitoribacter nigricans]PHN07214.1 phosphoglucosamine mutase [Flavilitoribacter nigricans DSM 23189 = NBRC 102662]